MKGTLKAVLPVGAVQRIQQMRRSLMHLRNRHRSSEQIFSEIYAKHLWGGGEADFYSGLGGEPVTAAPYAELVRSFIVENGIRSVVDLGCGDFRVGSLLKVGGVRYTGIDVVPSLISRNKAKWATDEITFDCRDIVADDLPAADLCLIRQVLQHLSNRQIQSVLSKLHQYPAVLVTEHYPPPNAENIVANKDMPAGSDTRIPDNSAVFLDQPPYNLEPVRLMLDIEVTQGAVNPGDRLKTFLFQHPRPRQ